MCNAVLWFIEAKCVTGKVNSPEEIGLMLSYSFSFMFLMACQSWIKISSFEVNFIHVAFFIVLDVFHNVVDYPRGCKLIADNTVLITL